MLIQKRRKRRRMLRERSPSPPMVQTKRQTPSPRLALSTRYSPDEMNNSPNFEEKKKFLTIFNLTHISAEKRKGMPPARARQGGGSHKDDPKLQKHLGMNGILRQDLENQQWDSLYFSGISRQAALRTGIESMDGGCVPYV